MEPSRPRDFRELFKIELEGWRDYPCLDLQRREWLGLYLHQYTKTRQQTDSLWPCVFKWGKPELPSIHCAQVSTIDARTILIYNIPASIYLIPFCQNQMVWPGKNKFWTAAREYSIINYRCCHITQHVRPEGQPVCLTQLWKKHPGDSLQNAN